jgi:uncharacterized protein YbbK (DUF523 family)
MTDPPILVSACLLGVNCRYDAKPLVEPDELRALVRDGRAIPFCPEEGGGLPTPREPASIESGKTGDDVLDGRARVLGASGRDHTAAFIAGAEAALAICRRYGIKKAYLKSKSPSCGVGQLRMLDGALEAGDGVTAALLRRNGIEVCAFDAAKA